MTKGKGKNPGLGGLSKHMKSSIHKERSQPASRQKYGALEKHKDYVKRAANRHKKQAKLQQLKRAAALRNPNEFHLKMTQLEVDPATGKMKKREDKSAAGRKRRTEEALANTKRDLQYLRLKMHQDRQKAMDLTNDVVGLDAVPQNKHTVFLDEEDGDVKLRSFDVLKHFDAPSMEDLRHPAIRSKRSVLGKTVPMDFDPSARRAGVKSKRDDVAEETANEQADREEVAVAFREIHERSRRHKHLKNLVTALEAKERRVHQQLHAAANAKYKKGVMVRQR